MILCIPIPVHLPFRPCHTSQPPSLQSHSTRNLPLPSVIQGTCLSFPWEAHTCFFFQNEIQYCLFREAGHAPPKERERAFAWVSITFV